MFELIARALFAMTRFLEMPVQARVRVAQRPPVRRPR
jgi:hypothetical protein